MIIEWITSGVPVRDIEARLKEKYPKKTQEHLRISFSTIQKFKTEHLNLKGEVLTAIKEVRQQSTEAMKHEMIKEELRKSKTYQEKINSIADDQLSVNSELIKVFKLIEDRMEVFYNKMTQHESIDVREERVFQKYLEQFTAVLEHYKKYVEGYTETSQQTVNIKIMDGQVSLIRDAVREVLAETEPDLAVKFMGKLHDKMNTLSYRVDGQTSTDLVINDVVVVE